MSFDLAEVQQQKPPGLWPWNQNTDRPYLFICRKINFFADNRCRFVCYHTPNPQHGDYCEACEFSIVCFEDARNCDLCDNKFVCAFVVQKI